jgi:hypothetical protein
LSAILGGHSSAIAAIEVVRKYGAEDTILLNHDINPSVENADVKRFKVEVAEYLNIPITYANHPDWESKDQFDIVIDAKAFKVGTGTALCTNRLKTSPFEKWLRDNYPDKNCVIYYGFDASEKVRIQRRVGVLSQMGYRSDYPLALWENRTIHQTIEVGINPPNTYSQFKHANCVGCLKAGKQHWYIVYCTRPDIWEKAKRAEDAIGYSIIKGVYLEELEKDFSKMQSIGIETTEHEMGVTFFARVRKVFKEIESDGDSIPCECVF